MNNTDTQTHLHTTLNTHSQSTAQQLSNTDAAGVSAAPVTRELLRATLAGCTGLRLIGGQSVAQTDGAAMNGQLAAIARAAPEYVYLLSGTAAEKGAALTHLGAVKGCCVTFDAACECSVAAWRDPASGAVFLALEAHHSRKTIHNWMEGLIMISAIMANDLLPFAAERAYGCLFYAEGQRERMAHILADDCSDHPAQIARATALAHADQRFRGKPAAQFASSKRQLQRYRYWKNAASAPDLPRLTADALDTLGVPFLDTAFELSRRLFAASPFAHAYVTHDDEHPKNAMERTLFSRYGVGYNMVDLTDLIPVIANEPNFTMDGQRQAGFSDGACP